MASNTGLKVATILLLCSLQSALSQGFDPYSPGPYSVFSFHVNHSVFPNVPAYFDVFSPTYSEQDLNMVYFIDGLGGEIPVFGYDLVLKRLSSHGTVTVVPYAPGSKLSAEDKIAYFQAIIDWCELHLTETLVMFGADPSISVNYQNTFALSHSSGAHVVCSYLKAGCGPFKGAAYWSPVDGADPWGIVDHFCTTVGEELNAVLPTLIMPASLDSAPGSNFSSISCAPDDLSNRRFYDAAGSQAFKWYINATGWGHGDFMDPGFQNIIVNSHVCAVNQVSSNEEFRLYRDHVAGEVVAFMRGLLEPDCDTYLQYLEEASLMPVPVENEYIAPNPDCPVPSCSWTPLP